MANAISTIQPIKPMTFSKIGENPTSADPSSSFSNILSDAVHDFESLQQTSEKDSADLAVGNANNLAQIQIDSLKAEASLQTTVQLTSRVVSAYKEIMQMQI